MLTIEEPPINSATNPSEPIYNLRVSCVLPQCYTKDWGAEIVDKANFHGFRITLFVPEIGEITGNFLLSDPAFQ
jgi:hypothetical protein